MLLIILSFLISIAFWLWIIMKYDKFERESIRSILFVFVIGGFISSVPAGILNDLFMYVVNHHFDIGFALVNSYKRSFLLFGFAGIAEEVLKAGATILLIRKMKGFNEPADALVYSMTVALGFAICENVLYSLKFGFAAFYLRQFNAVPLHIGLAAIWGMGIAKAKFLHHGKYIQTIAPYLLIAALFHGVYNFSTTMNINPLFLLFILSVIPFFLIRFGIRRIKQYSEEGPFANRLYCHSCNTVNFPYERVCKKCGQQFSMEFYTRCPDCNTKMSRSALSCPQCGKVLMTSSSRLSP